MNYRFPVHSHKEEHAHWKMILKDNLNQKCRNEWVEPEDRVDPEDSD